MTPTMSMLTENRTAPEHRQGGWDCPYFFPKKGWLGSHRRFPCMKRFSINDVQLSHFPTAVHNTPEILFVGDMGPPRNSIREVCTKRMKSLKIAPLQSAEIVCGIQSIYQGQTSENRDYPC